MSYCFSQWISEQTNQSLTPMDNLMRERALLDVSIEVLGSMGTPKEAVFIQDYSRPQSNVQLFDMLYRDASDQLIGVLIAPNVAQCLDQAQTWVEFAVSNSGYLNISQVEIRDLSAAVVHTVDVAGLVFSEPTSLDEGSSPSVVPVLDDDSSIGIDELAQSLAVWRLLAQEADQTSKKIEQTIAQRLDKKQLDAQAGQDFGIARTKLTKSYDVSKIDEKVVEIMKLLEYPDVEIQKNYNNHPNFWVDAKFDSETLVELIGLHLGIDVRQDARFEQAISQAMAPNPSIRLEYLENLAKSAGVDIDANDFVDWDATNVKTELVRESLTGSARHVRSAIVSALKSKMSPLVQEASQQYVQARTHLLAQAPKKKATRKKR